MKHVIFQKVEQANKPDFGDVLSKSFELFKKVWVEGTVHVLITFAIAIPVMILAYLPLVPVMIADSKLPHGEEFDPFVAYSLPVIIGYILLLLVLILVSQVFAYGISAHFYKVIQKADTGKPLDTGGYFVFLKRNFGKLFVLSLTAMGIALLATLLCYLPLFYVMVPLQLFIVLFAFNPQLSVSEIIKASFKLGNKFWLIIFGLIILSSLIAQLGMLLCFVGVFVTASFVHLPMYYVYKDSIGFDEDPLPSETVTI
ncbi:hypothetical protein [Marixanthomonas spongiae]|uniref:DUF975 family protein n=1 Tax=Marixanthomonas spongiae TaxID=2174845 RepID=A0A2U0I7Y3_9FLAO|nr:hypothetical protein [Marixanthomonas spongiae]PVW17197.1 hypothetical protein DDV96_01395 [Marixanthomonas spongiae]